MFTGFVIARFDCVLKMRQNARSPERCAVAGFCCLRKNLVQSDSHYSFFFYTLAHLKKKALVPELPNNEIVHLHMSQPFNTTKLRSNTARGQWILGSSYHSLFLVNLALAFRDGPPNKIVSRIEKLASMSCSQVTWLNFRNCTVRGGLPSDSGWCVAPSRHCLSRWCFFVCVFTFGDNRIEDKRHPSAKMCCSILLGETGEVQNTFFD